CHHQRRRLHDRPPLPGGQRQPQRLPRQQSPRHPDHHRHQHHHRRPHRHACERRRQGGQVHVELSVSCAQRAADLRRPFALFSPPIDLAYLHGKLVKLHSSC